MPANPAASLLSALALALALALACAGAPSGPPDVGEATRLTAAAAETAAALSVLEHMSRHLDSLPAFRFQAEIHYDAVQASGQRIEFGSTRDVAVRRPDRLRVEVAHRDGPRELLVYDGLRIVVAAPLRHVYATDEQSGPFEAVLARLEERRGVPMPLAELVEPALYERLEAQVESGTRVGIVQIEGRPCDQLAFRGGSVDFQVFVERGASPLPRRLVIDYLDEPGRPQFRASLHTWDTSPELPDGLFRLVAPVGAQLVPFEEWSELLFEVDADMRPGPRGGSS